MSFVLCAHEAKVLVCSDCAESFDNLNDALNAWDDLASNHPLGIIYINSGSGDDQIPVLFRKTKQRDGDYILYDLKWGDGLLGAAWINTTTPVQDQYGGMAPK
jgi:hypothetical protein